MRKTLLLLAFFGFIALVQSTAQTCSSALKAYSGVCSKTAATKAASMDASIQEKIDTKTGKASYVRKSTCPVSGKVSYTEVEFCTRSGKFINVSPSATAHSVSTASNSSCCPKNCSSAQKAACTKNPTGKKAALKAACSAAGTKTQLVKATTSPNA